MPFLTRFSRANRRLLLLLSAGHLLWSCALLGLWTAAQFFARPTPWVSALFVAVQLYAGAQVLLPALRLQPENRSRAFYLCWGLILALGIWLLNQLPAAEIRLPLPAVLKSGGLLLAATLCGIALARYLKRLWELIPICLMMALADFASWLNGPTAVFTQQIRQYYLAPVGPPPLIDMLLVKLALPGSAALAPVFGIADWIMVVFFASVARNHGVNDNLLGAAGETLARRGRIGGYLPVSIVALYCAIQLAQLSGRFIPALPLIALSMLFWYAGRYLWRRGR